MAGKGSRTLISSEQKAVLVSLFEAGMSSVSNDELLQDAARRTGLEIGHIRNWIGNHRRRLKPLGSKPKPKHKLLYTKGKSGYNYFVGEELSTGRSNTFDEAAFKWSSLDDANKCLYRQRAAEVKAAEPTHPLSPADRHRKVKRHLNQIDIEVSGLRAVGMEVVVLAFDPQNQNPIRALQTIVTNKGEGFLKATGASDDFAAYCKGVLFPSATSASFSTATASSKSESKKDLSKKVTALFSQKYRDARGEGLLPYMKAMKGYLKVNGLPDGLNLRKANRYGGEQLKKILKAADKISFEIVNQWAEENHEVGMAVPTPVNDQCVESSLQEKMMSSPEPSRSGSIKQEPEDLLDTRTVSIKQEPEDHLDTRSRTLISSEQKAILVSLFEAGMSSVSNDKLLQDAARRTGLEIGHIRNWIGNHRRRLKPLGSKPKPKHKLLYTKGKSGYNYFVGEELSTGRSNTFDEAAFKWSSLDDANKCLYRQRAAEVKAAEPTHPLSPADRHRKVKRHLNQIDIEVSGLRAVGMEVVVLAFDPQNQNPIRALQTIVTNKGEGFLKATGASDDFAAYCKGVLFPSATSASFSTATASSKSERSDLSKKVTALFSQKYRDAGGEGLLPYMKAMKGYLKVNGLPDGLNLRKANRYGVEKLKKILKAADKISFEIVNNWAEENHEVGMAVPTPVNDQCVESSLQEKMRISPEPSRSVYIKQEPEDHLDTRTVSIKQEHEDHLDTNILAPQIKEEQEELLNRPEDSEVNNDDADENGETEPIASTSTDQMNTHAYIEYWVKSQLTCDDQILSSHCSDSDTEDSDEWETMEDQSADQFLSSNSSESDTKDTLKSPMAHNVEGEMLSLSNKLSQDWKSSKQTKAMVFHKRTFSVDDCRKILKRIKSYKCTVCGKACRRKDYLEAHMSTHTGEKPFTCTVCGKSFTRIDNGRTHMKTHDIS